MIRKVGGAKQNYRTTYLAGMTYHRERTERTRPISRAMPGIAFFFRLLAEKLRNIGIILLAMLVHLWQIIFPRKAGRHTGRHASRPPRIEPRSVEPPAEPARAAEPETIPESEVLYGVTLRSMRTRRDGFTVVERGFALRTGLIAAGAVLALTLIATIPAVNVYLSTKTVTLVDGTIPIEISSTASTVGQLMDEYGIRLNEGDIVYPERSASLERDTHIQIRRAMSVDILADGVARTLRIQAGTARDALAIAGIAYSGEDIIEPSLNEKLTPGMTIDITRVSTEMMTETERIHYREIVQEDKTILVGQREVSQKGKEGQKELEIEVVYHDGEEISREVVGERIIEAPVHRIVLEGTKTAAPKPTATPRATRASTSSASSSAPSKPKLGKYAVTYDGKSYTIKDTDRFMITAYTHTGRKTSTGTWPKVGTIAVDPKVIPYGTYIYIPGYGIGKAADTGVSGKQLDLFFDTREECIEYGRQRDVKIYILEDPVRIDD